MPAFEDFVAAEQSMRRLLEDEGLPAPDRVEYRDTEIVMLWHETGAAIVIDVTVGPDHDVTVRSDGPPEAAA